MFEVNLVPDVKAELLRTQKIRNLVIYISIIVALGCAGVIVLLASIIGGQGIALVSQDNEMTRKSEQILNSKNLNLNLTVQDQLGKLESIGDNRHVLSRIFGILDVILPTGDNIVTVSELSIDLPNSVVAFDGQADNTDDIDYEALEVFKHTARRSYYDFGHYIDSRGNEIPSFCVEEVVENGLIVGVYDTSAAGCSFASTGDDEEDEDSSTDTPTQEAQKIRIIRDMTVSQLQDAKNNSKPYFQSECITDGVNECLLLSDDAVVIRESSNGRNSAGDLVLRFSAVINIDPEVFSFNNKHMRILGPTRQNVTDSYVQVRNMFTEEAQDCAIDDTNCINGGGN